MKNQVIRCVSHYRVAIPIWLAWEMPEAHIWAYNEDLDEMGLDPWKYLDCDIDRDTATGEFLLRDKPVSRNHQVYMQVPHA